MNARQRTLLATISFLASCAVVDEQSLAPPRNWPPQASLRTPVIAPVGRPVTLDASASNDPDDEPLSYLFEFNDGTPPVRSADPMVQHTFATAGLYAVRVTVIDLAGAESLAMQDITVRDEYPAAPSFCSKAADCIVGDECEGGVCYCTGGGVP